MNTNQPPDRLDQFQSHCVFSSISPARSTIRMSKVPALATKLAKAHFNSDGHL
jgi:hypothetical protein